MKDFIEMIGLSALAVVASLLSAVLALILIAGCMLAMASPVILIVWLIMNTK